MRKLGEVIAQAREHGDEQEFNVLMEKQDGLIEEAKKRRWQEIKNEGPEAVDVEMVDLFAKMPRMPAMRMSIKDDQNKQAKLIAEEAQLYEKHRRLLQKWHFQIGERMGQIPCIDGQPKPGAERFSCTGLVLPRGLLLRIDGIMFVRPGEGAAALIDWLRNRGCSDFKYEFHAGGGRGEDRD